MWKSAVAFAVAFNSESHRLPGCQGRQKRSRAALPSAGSATIWRLKRSGRVTTSAWTFESTFLAGLTPSIPVVATSWASSTLDLFLGQSGAIVQRSLR